MPDIAYNFKVFAEGLKVKLSHLNEIDILKELPLIDVSGRPKAFSTSRKVKVSIAMLSTMLVFEISVMLYVFP